MNSNKFSTINWAIRKWYLFVNNYQKLKIKVETCRNENLYKINIRILKTQTLKNPDHREHIFPLLQFDSLKNMTELKTLELNRADIPTWTPYLSRYRAEWQIASAEQWKLPMGSSPWTTSCKSINHKLLVIPPLVMAVSHVWLKKKKKKNKNKKEGKKKFLVFFIVKFISFIGIFFFLPRLGLNILSLHI